MNQMASKYLSTSFRANLCNAIETTKDDLVDVTIKQYWRLLTEYLLEKAVDILPNLMRQLQPFHHTIDSYSSQFCDLKVENHMKHLHWNDYYYNKNNNHI